MCREVAWVELTTEVTFVVRIQSGMPDKKEYRSIRHWLMMQVLYFFLFDGHGSERDAGSISAL